MINDCFAHDQKRLLHHQAIDILKENIEPIAKVGTCPLEKAYGRILAEKVTSPKNIPGFDNSAMDGFAFDHSEYLEADGLLKVTERVVAGDNSAISLGERSAARIFTGAQMPSRSDTVAMQEDCEMVTDNEVNFVKIPQGYKKGANVRLAGEDVQTGQTILDIGTRLRPQELAAIASCGFAEVNTYEPLKIALVSTGDEICRPGQKIEQAGVYDSNFYLLSSLLKNLPVSVTDLGILADDADAIESKLIEAAEQHDVIISSGGASLGDEDHITRLLAEKGARHLWQLAIKPGRPVCFGHLNQCYYFGLPGNPVASYVCFLLYIYPSLLRLAGKEWQEPTRYQIPSAFELTGKKTGRREFWRGFTKSSQEGKLELHKFERDGSGLISGLRKASGLIEINEDAKQVTKGELLNFIPFSQFGVFQ